MSATSPAASGPAGPHFEGEVAAYYLLSLLTGGQPRGLSGTIIDRIELQRASEGHPLDDVIVQAHDLQGRPAVLAIQAKRSMSFAPADSVFRAVVAQIAETLQRQDFWPTRYELAIAIARTTQKIDGSYQDVLAWARELGSAAVFMGRIARPGSANDDMRTFVQTFRGHLHACGAASDDETVWRLLQRLQILTFDFAAPGSSTVELMRERAAHALHPDDASRAPSLWANLVELAIQVSAQGGDRTRDRLVQDLRERSFTRLAGNRNFTSARAHLFESARHALADIGDHIGSVLLTRQERLSAVRSALDQGRYVEIRGEAGVGKSAVLKHLATGLAHESQVIVLSPNRTTPNGWSALRGALHFDGTAHDLLADLASDGGAVLFIDSLDNFTEAEQKTAIDLVREVAQIPGFAVVATARHGFAIDEPNWLPAEALDRLGRTPPVVIGELSESEIAELRDAVPALARLLAADHPARDVIRNLYRLSRLSGVPATEPVPRTEIDMAQQWWQSADGRRDSGHRDRARVLLTLAEQAVLGHQPLSVAGHPSAAIDALVRSETLRDLGGDRVAFRHDVLREWAVAHLLHSDPTTLERLPLQRPAPVWLARSLELTARMGLEPVSGEGPWPSLLERVSGPQTHGSWRRAVLLACVRSEMAATLLEGLSSALLAQHAKLLRELIRTVLAVEVEPFSKRFVAAEVREGDLPTDLIKTPSGPSWARLILWLMGLGERLPEIAIPEIVELYSGWCIGTLGQDPLTPLVVRWLYRWLLEIENAQRQRDPGNWKEPFGGQLQEHQIRALESSLRGTFVLFSNRVPDLAAQYLQLLTQRESRDTAITSVLKFRGTLAQAAPVELAQLTAATLIPQHSNRARREPYDLSGPFGFADHQFLPASPAQGPFYELLVHAPGQGLALIRQLVMHAISFYADNRPYGTDVIPIAFPEGERKFPWQRSYFWSRDEAHHSGMTSALMALEAWSHTRIEAGTKLESVLDDVLGSGEVPAAYLLIAVDLLLSHWPSSREAAIPFLSSPELLCLDRHRAVHDSLEQPDVFGFKALQKEPRGAATLAMLKKRHSRRRLLDTLLGQYAVGDATDARERLRELLQRASERLGPPDPDSNLGDPSFMVLHALNLSDSGNWKQVTVPLAEGKSASAWEYVPPPFETEHLKPQQEAALPRQTDSSYEAALGLALEDPARSSVELAAAGVAWAQQASQNTTPGDKDTRWMREQAIFAAALVLARDGGPELRALHGDWARTVFARALQTEEDPGRSMRPGLRFNPIAIAFVGLAHLLRDRANPVEVRAILEIAVRTEPAGAHGFAAAGAVLAKINERLPRAILRCAFAASLLAVSHWNTSEEEMAAYKEQLRQRRHASVDAEMAWLSGEADEPAWPSFPAEVLRVRRGLRIGEVAGEAERRRRPQRAGERINYHGAALWLRAAMRQSVADAPWLCEVIKAYSDWTFGANGAGLPRDEDVENAPDEWNQVYFELLAICFSSCNLSEFAVKSISELPDESFFDVLPTFLRTLDGVYFDARGLEAAEAANTRSRLAERMMASRRWIRLRGTSSNGIEMHIGPAIAVLFFNVFYPFAAPPWCYLNPVAVDRLDSFVPTLERLATGSPCLFVALVTLNLLEVSPRPSHLPWLLAAANAWLETYADDTVFWLDKDVGKRVCAVIDRSVTPDPVALERDATLRNRVEGLLSELIRLGVPEASALERRWSLPR